MDTSLARDTAKGVACETTGRNLGEFRLHSVPGCMIDTKAIRNTILSCLHFCFTKNRIIISFLRVIR